jgi:hypothetical protein
MVQSEQATAVGQDATERTLRFAQAMVDGDADALEALLAPGFTYTHKNARVEPREELIESVRNGRRNARMDLEDLSARGYGGTAVVQGLNHMRVDLPGGPLEFDSHFSAVWVEDGGEPRLALYHSTGVPED